MLRYIIATLSLLNLTQAFAASDTGIGGFAKELVEPVNIVSNFIGTGSIVIGIACLFAAFLRYMQYRVNHLASPLSTVIILLILGIVLLCLPFIYLITGGVPYPATR